MKLITFLCTGKKNIKGEWIRGECFGRFWATRLYVECEALFPLAILYFVIHNIYRKFSAREGVFTIYEMEKEFANNSIGPTRISIKNTKAYNAKFLTGNYGSATGRCGVYCKSKWKIQRFLQVKLLIIKQNLLFMLELPLLFRINLSTIFKTHEKTRFS